MPSEPIGFRHYNLTPDQNGKTAGLLSIVVNLAGMVGVDEAIQLIEHYRDNAVPETAKIWTEKTRVGHMAACDLALKTLRNARKILLRPLAQKRVIKKGRATKLD